MMRSPAEVNVALRPVLERLIKGAERFRLSLFDMAFIEAAAHGGFRVWTDEPGDRGRRYATARSAVNAFLRIRDRRQLGYDYEREDSGPISAFPSESAAEDDLVRAVTAPPGFIVTFRRRLSVWPPSSSPGFAVTFEDSRGVATWEEIFERPEAAVTYFLRCCLGEARGKWRRRPTRPEMPR
jgi:hypothetical protein